MEEGRQITAYVHPAEYEAIDAGRLVSVKIACQSETARAMLSISRTGDPFHLTIHTEHREGTSEEHVRFDPPQIAGLLMIELDASPHDPQYNRILSAAVPLISAARA